MSGTKVCLCRGCGGFSHHTEEVQPEDGGRSSCDPDLWSCDSSNRGNLDYTPEKMILGGYMLVLNLFNYVERLVNKRDISNDCVCLTDATQDIFDRMKP